MNEEEVLHLAFLPQVKKKKCLPLDFPEIPNWYKSLNKSLFKGKMLICEIAKREIYTIPDTIKM